MDPNFAVLQPPRWVRDSPMRVGLPPRSPRLRVKTIPCSRARTRLTHPDGNFFTYQYDPADRLTGILEGATTSLLSIAYDNFGRRSSLARTGAGSTGYSYDGLSRLTSLSHDLAGTANDQALTFAYNPASQIVSRTGSNDGLRLDGACPRRDRLHRQRPQPDRDEGRHRLHLRRQRQPHLRRDLHLYLRRREPADQRHLGGGRRQPVLRPAGAPPAGLGRPGHRRPVPARPGVGVRRRRRPAGAGIQYRRRRAGAHPLRPWTRRGRAADPV